MSYNWTVDYTTVIVYCSNDIVEGAGYVVDGARVVDGSFVDDAAAAATGILNCDGGGSGVVEGAAGANAKAIAAATI